MAFHARKRLLFPLLLLVASCSGSASDDSTWAGGVGGDAAVGGAGAGGIAVQGGSGGAAGVVGHGGAGEQAGLAGMTAAGQAGSMTYGGAAGAGGAAAQAGAGGSGGSAGAGQAGAGGGSGMIDNAAVIAVMKKVADYQLKKWGNTNPSGWIDAAGWTGFVALYEVSRDAKYLDAAKAWATANSWALNGDTSNADNQCAAQVYFDLYLLSPSMTSSYMVDGAKPAFDAMVSANKAGWGWVDALFMSPPGVARLYAITHDSSYLDLLFSQWNKTKGSLYSSANSLWWRDPPPAVGSGKPRDIFWSRGNGWVMAASARVLQRLPAEQTQRSIFVDNLKAMAQALVPLQQADGTWHSDLLHPSVYDMPESSGSAFFTFALAYGINAGFLDSATFRPVVNKAWQGLLRCVQTDGLFGYVQPPNWAPGASKPTDTSAYGVGAFLLAGSEYAKLKP